MSFNVISRKIKARNSSKKEQAETVVGIVQNIYYDWIP